jgi:hypothetical protein
MTHGALHHFTELDFIAGQINGALKEDGLFVTQDLHTKNGDLLWPAEKIIINSIFLLLPMRFRKDSYTNGHDILFKEIDYSRNTFECINSENVVRSLRKSLVEREFVYLTCISRRFFFNRYGFNFIMKRRLDNFLVRFIYSIDRFFMQVGILRHGHFFGVYSKKLKE